MLLLGGGSRGSPLPSSSEVRGLGGRGGEDHLKLSSTILCSVIFLSRGQSGCCCGREEDKPLGD